MKSKEMIRRPVDRRGIVLILALGMLALFTVVAITLASISRTQATAAGNFKRLEQYGSNTLTVRPEEVNDLFRYALNQLVFDTRNRQSAIRGHSLLRDMYGSPTTYSLTSDPGDATGYKIGSLSSVSGDGAELRLKQKDLRRLLNIPLANDNDLRLMALDYQKVYNGTGVFPPRKIDFSGVDISDPKKGIQKGFDNLYLQNREIAAQVAFMNVPGRLMPATPTSFPTNVADWKAILNPYAGTLPASAAYWLPLFPINYTEFDAFSPNGTLITRVPTVNAIDPERFTYVVNGVAGPYPQGDHWFGADEDYDYPDINNMFLAMERADGKMLIPSFHRPGIIAQVADGVNTLTGYGATAPFIAKLPWYPYNSGATSGNPPADFHGLVLRPRAADRDPKTLGIASPRAGRFREMADSYVHSTTGTVTPGQDGLPDDLDSSGAIGDHPAELDVDTDGDGLKDSVWVDLGAPVIQVGDSAVKPLFAFKVVGLDGKINLNVAGNLYKSPNPEDVKSPPDWSNSLGYNTVNYTLQHKSNLGASPTEINPQHAIILGDNPGPNIWPRTLPASRPEVRPPDPIWGFLPYSVTGSTFPDPYQRLLIGYQNLYTGDQAPGRWTGTADNLNLPGISSSDDNGNLTRPKSGDINNPALLAKSKSFIKTSSDPGYTPYPPEFGQPFEYSEGDGNDPISTLTIDSSKNPSQWNMTLPVGRPAMVGAYSPIDTYGLGTKYSPYSNSALKHATGFGLLATDGNLLSAYLNYGAIPAAFGSSVSGHIDSLDDGKVLPTNLTLPYPSIAPVSSGLDIKRIMTNEAAETNVYYPSDDYLFTAADIAVLLRANDFDSSANQSRLVNLLPDQMGERSVEISAGATTASPSYYSPESYARQRMRNLFTHESWDLIRYSAPPTFHSAASSAGLGNGLYLGPTVAGSPGELFDISGDTANFANNPVEAYLARSHSGEGVPNFISQLLSYKLPTNTGGDVIAPPASSPFATMRDVYEQLALTLTADGKDFLIPYEVQMGRRLDLNRPLTAYNTTDVADKERESFAQQLYILLAIASGTCGVDPTSKLMTVQARWAQARTIAQIAVNIVDYMDSDSVMTMMHFDPDLSDGWDLSKPLNDPVTGTAIVSPGDDFNSITTVIGFELPQLIINETLTVITDDNSSSDVMNPVRDEYQFTWVELFNPWPASLDPVGKSTPGVQLASTNESTFILQINRLNGSNPDGGGTPPNPAVTVDQYAPYNIKDIAKGMSQLVTFRNDGDPGAPTEYNKTGIKDGTGTGGLSIPGGNVSDSYFVVGPPTKATAMTTNTTLKFPAAPKYSASACGTVWKKATAASSVETPLVEVRLYRKRNPFLDITPGTNTNPYVVIDAVSQQFNEIESIRAYSERTVGGSVNSATVNKQKSGLYFVGDPTIKNADKPGYRPAWAKDGSDTGSYPGNNIDISTYASWQRRQPWHGYNGDWQPYIPQGTKHPFIGSFLGKVDQNLEGAFLGLPNLSDPRRNSTATTPAGYYTTDDNTNGMRQNGFVPASQTLGNSNSVAFKRWETFPFLNRQLATPLELLSVRLYGSHLWYTNGGSIKEWRLRFTDDFEFFPHPWRRKAFAGTDPFYERMWRSRQIPWYQDSRVLHPTFPTLTQVTDLTDTTASNLSAVQVEANAPDGQLPLPHLYRFFELVECRSRMNNGIPASQQWTTIPTAWPSEISTTLPTPKPGRSAVTAPVVPGPTTVLATRRAERTPGKINLNLITEEEVYKALLDSVETSYYDLMTDFITNRDQYSGSTSVTSYSVGVSDNYWPLNYWWTTTTGSSAGIIPGALFSPLGQAPLGDPVGKTLGDPAKQEVLDVIDALGRMVAWSSLTLSNTTSATVTTPPLQGAPAAPVLSTGGFDIRTIWLFGVTTQTTKDLFASSSSSDPNSVMFNSSKLMSLNPNITNSPNLQFPGIVNGPDPNNILYPGTNPARQVHSEMYRAFLLSRSGPDGIHGTADDKPFRSFASDDVSDTILRVRNSATNGLVKEGAVTATTTLVNISTAESTAIVMKSFLDGSNDVVTMTTPSLSFYAGDYIARLGGQRSPGLFDAIPDPYSDFYAVIGGKNVSIPHLLPIGADPSDVEFQERLPSYAGSVPDSPDKLPVDYWVLEERRNELLAKISGNVTTRSHVFAVWVAVGFFRVEPGTEGLKVPLLGAEVGSEAGKAFRHRAFFIIDRSQAKSYDPEDIDANFDFDIMRQKKLLEYYKIIE